MLFSETGVKSITTYTYNFDHLAPEANKVDGRYNMTLNDAIRIVDGIHSNYVGAINRTYFYNRDTHAKALEMVINAAKTKKRGTIGPSV